MLGTALKEEETEEEAIATGSREGETERGRRRRRGETRKAKKERWLVGPQKDQGKNLMVDKLVVKYLYQSGFNLERYNSWHYVVPGGSVYFFLGVSSAISNVFGCCKAHRPAELS